MSLFIAEPASVPAADVLSLFGLAQDLVVRALPLAGAAVAGWLLAGLAAKVLPRRVFPFAALAIAALSFTSILAAEVWSRELEYLVFQIGCLALMLGCGSGGWLFANTWKMAAIIAVGPSTLLLLLSPLWRLALACGLLGSCP